ncbi:hypothetical protein ACQ1Z2_14420, partial [Enterococcus faecalis]|uniref:hypothetical protein n=1 Tax=Enterococcus faecalis TaxID=1351 RepID=UPI003D6B9BCB
AFTTLRRLGGAEAARRQLAPKAPPPRVDSLLLVALALLPTALAAAAYAAIGQWDAFVYANFLSIFHRNPDPLGELAGNLGQIVLLTSPLVALAILALRR